MAEHLALPLPGRIPYLLRWGLWNSRLRRAFRRRCFAVDPAPLAEETGLWLPWRPRCLLSPAFQLWLGGSDPQLV